MGYNLNPDLSPFEDAVLFEEGEHRVVYLGSRGSSHSGSVDVLSYLIVNGNAVPHLAQTL